MCCHKAVDDGLAFDLWQATKGNCVIETFGPPELLGLIMIYETYGQRWATKTTESGNAG